jgi:uncharacterized protein
MSADSLPKAHATPTAERVHALDVLRGLALLGMILVHFHFHSLELGGVDGLVRTAVWRLVESKSHGMFAMLFGAGFAIQLRRAEAREAPFAMLYLRRLVVLALFGFGAHSLFGFNVLLGYAAWGVPLLLIRRWSTGALVATAVLSVLSMALVSLVARTYATASLGPEDVEAAFQARREVGMRVNAALRAAAAQPDYAPLVAARLRHMAWFYAQPFFYLPGHTLALFIAGLLAVRHGVLEHPLAHKRGIGAMMVFGVVAWIAGNWLPPAYWLLGLLSDQWLAFAYAGGALLLLARYPRWTRLLRPIGQAGRMALTNYLVQIAVLDVIFSGYGVHLPDIRPILVPLATVLLFGAEVAVSMAWLARFRFGPAEWAWRSLTYGRAQPMLK